MSFGFGVGDFIAGASLAYKLYEALSDVRGSKRQFAQLSQELLVVHQVLSQVEQLRANNQLAHDTLNALLFLTNGISEAIEDFQPSLKQYEESLQEEGSGNRLKGLVKKGMWKFHMPDHIQQLHDSLTTNLLSLNILVQVACFYNLSSSETPYFSRFDQGATSPTALDDRFPGIASYAHIDTGYTFSKSPNFQKRDNPFVFFRPGQVFSIQCKGLLSLRTEQEDPTKIDWNNLPLSRVRGIKERSSLARQHRLEQILGLPLDAMFKYAIITGDDKIICSLCPNDNSVYTKEMWIEQHFYLKHWDIYSSLPTTGNKLSRNWISLDDIKSDYPFGPNPEDSPSFATDVWVGSIFLRRFIVVREGTKSCLCLGVHTYAGRGCSAQTDQEVYGILHSSKIIPSKLDGETNMHLRPIRMKADHPSLTLPDSARIHFGRVYEVEHDVQVKQLGLIHDTSIQDLLSQFELYAPKLKPEDNQVIKRWREIQERDSEVLPADVNTVEDIRNALHKGHILEKPRKLNRLREIFLSAGRSS